jgi:ferredoxin
MCAALVPEQFDVGADGKVELLSDTVSLGQLSDVELAIDSCPTQALRLTE